MHDAGEVAAILGMHPERVYKTCIQLRDRGLPLLVMTSAPTELDRHKLARALGAKRVEMAPRREAGRLTGLQAGGIGTFALLRKGFDVGGDAAAGNLDSLLVNGGRRGLNLKLATDDLVADTSARFVDAASPVAPLPASARTR